MSLFRKNQRERPEAVQSDTLKELLRMLHPDENEAALEYQKLHRRLTRFFEWNNAEDPMALADEALDRVASRAAEPGMRDGVQKASAFALGVARHLLQEEARRRQKRAELSRQWNALESARSSQPETEAMEDALQQCLNKMQPERRRLIEAYYSYRGKEKIEMHQKLAEQEGISLNALRNRVLRTRQDLEACIRERIGKNIQ